MRVRYVGTDESRDLAFPGGCITFPRSEWVDLDQGLEGAVIPAYHAEIVIRGLGPDWELDTKKKSRKQPAAPIPDSDEEQS